MKKCLYLCTRKRKQLTIKTITEMKSIYVSLPITGQEDTYEERLQELVKVAEGFARYKKLEDADFCEYEIITPKDVAYGVEDRMKNPKYTDYILACLDAIVDCDVVILGDGWLESKGCRIEANFAQNMNIFVVEEELIKRNNWQA